MARTVTVRRALARPTPVHRAEFPPLGSRARCLRRRRKGFFPSVEASERRLALSAFFSLFGILTAHTMLETARDTLFLSRLPLGRLPYVYLAIAALSALLVRVAGGGGTPRGTKQPVTLPLALIFAALVDGAFWLLSTYHSPAIYYALYIWSGIFGSWAVLTFWYLLARVVDVQRAKRLYPVIGAGALAGGIFGSAVARVIVWLVPSGASMVILGSGVILVLNALGPTLVFARDIGKSGTTVERSRRGGDDDEVQPASSVLGDVIDAAKSAHVRKLLASVLITNVAATLIDFLFKTYAFKHVDQANYGAFFSTTSLAFNLAALVVQLFFAGGLLRLVGAHRALQLLPLLFILTGVGTAFSSLIWLPLLYKGFDSAVRPSLMRTANELLLLPLPDNVRRGSKVMIDLFGQRIGQAMASLMILCAMSWAVREGHMVAGIVILSALGVYVNVQLRPGYLDLFRAKLRDGFLGSDALPALDLDAVETLFTALNSPREGDVLAAIEILKEGGKLSLVPDLILLHPSTEVVLRVMPWLAIDRGRSLHPILERLVLPWAPPRVRAASLRMLVDQDHDCTLLQTYIADPAVEVAATSLVGMIAMNRMKDAEIAPALEKALHFEDDDPNRAESNRARVALFDAMAWHPSKKFVPILDSAADDADPMVRRAVAHAISQARRHRPAPRADLDAGQGGRARRCTFVPRGVRADGEPRARKSARRRDVAVRRAAADPGRAGRIGHAASDAAPAVAFAGRGRSRSADADLARAPAESRPRSPGRRSARSWTASFRDRSRARRSAGTSSGSSRSGRKRTRTATRRRVTSCGHSSKSACRARRRTSSSRSVSSTVVKITRSFSAVCAARARRCRRAAASSWRTC